MRSALLPAILVHFTVSAQPFAIGERSVDLFDPGRNRTIPCDVYHPADAPGIDVPLAGGIFPVLVLGHGFVMSTGAYTNFSEAFVPRGYILVLPTTEGGLIPAHEEFGLDLAFAAQALQAANGDTLSPFFGHVAPATALMGHSMGGGASFLGADGNPGIQTLVNFAAAETSPSAIAAAANVLVPTLMFAASEDCVTPIADHQQPMYDALTVPCRALVTVLGGGHCYFAESNFNCSFGEFTCGPNLAISREEQHDVVEDVTGLWLDHFLKGEMPAFTAFQDSMAFSSRITALSSCLSTSVADIRMSRPVLFPVPADDRLRIQNMDGFRVIGLMDALGRPRTVRMDDHGGGSWELHTGGLTNGSYHLVLDGNTGSRAVRFVVMHAGP